MRVSSLIVQAALISTGLAGVWVPELTQANSRVRERVAYSYSGGSPVRIDDYLPYASVAADLGLGLAGVPARHDFRDRFLVTTTAYATMSLVVKSLKYTVRETRPDGTSSDSFPSGHTATAMMAAEIVRVEYGPWWGLGAYTLGLGTAYLRLYNDCHWVNDVICGAGIGILAARVGYWLLPVENRLIERWTTRRDNRSQLAVSAVPLYETASRSAGLSLSVVF